MKRFWLVAALVALPLMALVPIASAETGCPPAFHAHTMGDMHAGDHQHVGLAMDAVDKNGNGVICVKHVSRSGNIHVHVDDHIP